jgi:ankyrin repeat protein
MKVLVGAAVNVNTTSTGGWTGLHWAADSGQKAAAAELLSLGAAVDSVDSQGRTPLHLAALKSHLPVLGALLCGGAALNARDSQGYTPLLTACSGGKEQVLVELLRCGAQPDVRDSSGNTALHIACSKEHMGIISRLLQVPKVTAHINAANNSWDTPLYAAAKAGRQEVVQLLLKYRAGTHARTQGMTPLHAALEGGHAACLEALLQGGADADVLYGAGAVNSQGSSIPEGTNTLQRAIQLRAIEAVLLLATPTNLLAVCEGVPLGEDQEVQQVLQLLGYGPQSREMVVSRMACGARGLLRDVDSPAAEWRLEQVVSSFSSLRDSYGPAEATSLLEQVLQDGRSQTRPLLAMQVLRGVHSRWLAAMPWLHQKWGITHRLQLLVIEPLQQQRQQQCAGRDMLGAPAAAEAGGVSVRHPPFATCSDLWSSAQTAANGGQWPLFVQHLEQLTGQLLGKLCAV